MSTISQSTLTKIMDALAAEGIEAVEMETFKNGIPCTGFRIHTGSTVSPVVYYSPDETVEAFVEKVRMVLDQPAPAFDVESLISRERLLDNSFLCLQKKGTEQIVKKSYLNLELYVRLAVDAPGDDESRVSIKVTPQILEYTDLSEEDLWAAAATNSLEWATILSMPEAIGMPEEMFDPIPFYVGTYKDKCHGAGILALPEALHGFCETKKIGKVYILPSSTEEVLLLPIDSADPAELSTMVHEVNISMVDPVLRMEESVFLYDDETRQVSIAATYEE